MIRIRDISLPPQQDMAQLVYAAARQLRIDHTQIKQLDIKKRSVDARKKNDVRLIYTVDVLVKGREDKILKMAHNPKAAIAQEKLYTPPKGKKLLDERPVIVGFGPGGLSPDRLRARTGREDAAGNRTEILGDGRARPFVQRTVRRGRRGHILGRQAQHGREQSQKLLGARAVRKRGRGRGDFI